MKHLIFIILILFLLPVTVHAVEFQAPPVPESGKEFMPNDTESFGEGLWSIVQDSIAALRPTAAEAGKVCISIIAAVILCCVVKTLPGSPGNTIELICTLSIGLLLLQPSNTLIRLAADTIVNISSYGKLLLPVLTAALAANGGVTKSAALYAGTVAFDTALCAALSSLVVPLVYIFLCLSVASAAIGNNYIDKIKSFIKWALTWGLKIVLYVFSGYMTITGVITGSADATAVKAAKLTISGMVPVVGGLISDASETVLVSSGIVKNAVGVYGLLAIIAICIGPFIKIGVQYLLLKTSCALCEAFAGKNCCMLIEDFSSAMGLLLAMTGTVSLLQLISIVCFMKGVS